MDRSAGILAHFSSLPSAYGIGDFGPEALRFVDWMALAGLRWWQVLPIAPTAPGLGNSPYSSYSAFAGNTDYISPDLLVREELISRKEADADALPSSGRVDFEAVRRHKRAILRKAFARARSGLETFADFRNFCNDNGTWLNDFAMFMALKDRFKGLSWTSWPEELRDRQEHALHKWGSLLAEEVLFRKHCQFLFFRQYGGLRARLADREIRLIGDAPIYVTHDSAEVWSNRELFRLDETGRPTHVAGVPPDYFSETGQRWGNPVFNWQANMDQGFKWWISRLRHCFGLFDLVRLDHFRGFAAYWEIDADEETAINGKWVRAPGRQLFEALSAQVRPIPLIAEDLGVITRDVVQLKNDFGFPGMKILQFGFVGGAGPDSGDIPYNHERNSVAYTGTHDNNTTRGWFENDLTTAARTRFAAYAGKRITRDTAAGELIRMALASRSALAVIPAQDLLNLDQTARMNIPSSANGNWSWRLLPGQLTTPMARELRGLIELFGRDGIPALEHGDYPTPLP